jgi:hypothetical protein
MKFWKIMSLVCPSLPCSCAEDNKLIKVIENLVVQSPAAPYIGTNPPPSAIPLPTIETMLNNPILPHSVYETMCYGEDRVLPEGQQLPVPTIKVDYRAPVNKFGVREMETIKEDRHAEEKNSHSWI